MISQMDGADPHQLHTQSSVLQGTEWSSIPQIRTGRYFHISSYRQSQSLCYFGARTQCFPERTAARASYDRQKTKTLLFPPRTDMCSFIVQCLSCETVNQNRPSLPLNSVLPSVSLRKAQSLRVVVEARSPPWSTSFHHMLTSSSLVLWTMMRI